LSIHRHDFHVMDVTQVKVDLRRKLLLLYFFVIL